MYRPVDATVWLDLPEVIGRSVLKNSLMAMGVVPSNLPSAGRSRDAALRRLADRPRHLAFIDISHRVGDSVSKLLNLAARVPWMPVRHRIILTRLLDGPEMGHVSEADRYWVRRLGFQDLVAELDNAESGGGLQETISMVTSSLDIEPLPPERLKHLASSSRKAVGMTSPRLRLRELCGCSAEVLCKEMHSSLDIHTRRLYGKSLKYCFFGSEAVVWLSERFALRPDQAVDVGRDLMSMGLLAHVAHQHLFEDGDQLYQLTVSEIADGLDPWQVLARLTGPEGPTVEQRSYLHKERIRCWVGSEAVDCLVKWHGIERFDAWIVLHRLMQFGLIDHITRTRPFIDGRFYYRFTGLPCDVTQ